MGGFWGLPALFKIKAVIKIKPITVQTIYKAPITNTKPYKAVSLLQIYNVIKGDYYKARNFCVREISDVVQARKFKATNFDYCAFSGTFEIRNDKALIKHSYKAKKTSYKY